MVLIQPEIQAGSPPSGRNVVSSDSLSPVFVVARQRAMVVVPCPIRA
ncbi:hypothetical protein KCP77_05220 [Salmonella enterica subsp. enterica]|nr:hypothetical protein KCP77_05220 [Salmonella enterica subsp. enterica]